MTSYLRTLALLLVVLAVLIPVPCTSIITGEINSRNCPTAVISECRRGLKWDTKYARISSKKFESTFLCDTKTDGGGWIVIQRRINKDTSFNQNWERYKKGFGLICGDYWLGNKNIHKITSSGKYELRIDMVNNSKNYVAIYDNFFIDDEDKNFALHIRNFTGNTKDDFMYHNGKPFSTPDRDNDPWPERHCAGNYEAGWWYNKCHQVNLNGRFNYGGMLSHGLVWIKVTGAKGSLSAVEMKVREKGSSSRRNSLILK